MPEISRLQGWRERCVSSIKTSEQRLELITFPRTISSISNHCNEPGNMARHARGNAPQLEDQYLEYGQPDAFDRETQRRRAEQLAAHSRNTLAALEVEAKKKWALQNPGQAAIRYGQTPQPVPIMRLNLRRLPDNAAADGHRAQQPGASISSRNGSLNGSTANRSNGVTSHGSSGASRVLRRPSSSRALLSFRSTHILTIY